MLSGAPKEWWTQNLKSFFVGIWGALLNHHLGWLRLVGRYNLPRTMMLQKKNRKSFYTKTSSRWYFWSLNWAKKDSESISSGGDRLNWIKNDLVPDQENKGGTWTQLAPQDWEIASILMLSWNLPQALFPPVTQVSFQKATPLHSVSPICSLCGTVSPIKPSISITFADKIRIPPMGLGVILRLLSGSAMSAASGKARFT